MGKYRAFTLVELVVSIGLFMVAISVSLVATVGTNSLIARTDVRSAIAESARSVTDTLRRTTTNAPVGSVTLHGYDDSRDTFAGVQVKAFSVAQAQTTCEVVGRSKATVNTSKEEVYTLDQAGDVIAYWVYRVDSGLQCPALGSRPLYQNRLTNTQVRATGFSVQMNSYDCDPTANCATKQQLRYSFSLELTKPLSGRSAESRTASTTVNGSLPIGLIETGIIPTNILTTGLPDGTVRVAYNKQIFGEGGRLPYQWSYAGSLVDGLSLAQQGNVYVLSGTPTVTGTVDITVTLRDNSNPPLTDQQRFIFSVGSGGGGISDLQITTTTLPIGVVGELYRVTLQASGGTGSLTWSLIGSLPSGLTLDPSSGQINGSPTVAGLFNFTVAVEDSVGNSDTRDLSILIEAAGSGPPGGGGIGGSGTPGGAGSP